MELIAELLDGGRLMELLAKLMEGGREGSFLIGCWRVGVGGGRVASGRGGW